MRSEIASSQCEDEAIPDQPFLSISRSQELLFDTTALYLVAHEKGGALRLVSRPLITFKRKKNMTSGVSRFLAVIFLAAALAGCASGPKYAEVTGAIPSIKNGQGRVYFLRSSTFFGGVAQPLIYVNNQAVGRSEPGGFFFVDLPAGSYQAKTTTETGSTLDFTIYPNETKYVRTATYLGLLVPRMEFIIVHESMAEQELAELSYTGKPLPTTPK